MADKGSKVTAVYSTDAHLYTPGIKRVGGPLGDGNGKPAKAPRYTVTDLLPEDDQGQLKWRGDPVDTYADWTIEVVFEGPLPQPLQAAAAPAPAPEVATSAFTAETPAAKPPAPMISPEPGFTPAAAPKAAAATAEVIEIQSQTNTYHVHRYFLGFGTRRSEYFAKLFKDARGSVSTSKKTKFELEPLAAKAFPDLLDFLYDPAMPLVIETDTATALHHLGVKFEMAHLQHYAREFCQKDLSLETLETYYQHAKSFEDKVVLDLIVEFIGKNIGAINSDSVFVKQQTDAALWKAALEHVTFHPVNMSTDLHLSKLITEFGVANKDGLTAATFEELTTKIRKVDPSVAFALCDLDDHLSPMAKEEDGLSSLQQRCATALAETWKELDTNEQLVQTRKAAFLVELLGKCLHEAKSENERLAGGVKQASTPRGRATGTGRAARGDRVESQTTSRSGRAVRKPH